MFRSAYHRISDDSVSSYGGHETKEEAIAEADENIKSFDIDEVWVRDAEGNIIYIRTKTD